MNGSYKGDDAIGKLMHDFGCKNSKDIYYQELAEGVKHFKEEGGRKVMCESVEKYGDRRAEKARNDERCETIKRMLRKGKAAEEISDLCGYELEFVQQVEEGMMQTI